MMTIEIVIKESDLETVRNEFCDEVCQDLLKKIENKNETLKWKNTIESCSRRFHNMIVREGIYFAEMALDSMGNRHRAIFIFDENEQDFLLYKFVQKEERYQKSQQHYILDQVHKHPTEILDDITQKVK